MGTSALCPHYDNCDILSPSFLLLLFSLRRFLQVFVPKAQSICFIVSEWMKEWPRMKEKFENSTRRLGGGIYVGPALPPLRTEPSNIIAPCAYSRIKVKPRRCPNPDVSLRKQILLRENVRAGLSVPAWHESVNTRTWNPMPRRRPERWRRHPHGDFREGKNINAIILPSSHPSPPPPTLTFFVPS